MFLTLSEEILYFVCGLGILQGILLAALIYFHPKSDRSVNTFLALHIFFISALMTIPFVIRLVSWKNSFFMQPLPFLVGPMLFLYLESFRGRVSSKKVILHLIPFFLFFFPVYWNIGVLAEKYPHLEKMSEEQLTYPVTVVLMYIRLAHLVLYYFLSRRSLKAYQSSIRHMFSETSRINLHWAKVLVNGYLFNLLCAIVIFHLIFTYPENFTLLLLINLAVGTPYLYIATYKGIHQPSLWQSRPDVKREVLEQELKEAEEIESLKEQPGKIRASKPVLNQDKIDETVKRITYLMEREKLYQEPELTVQQLAEKLDLPSYHVSQAINEGMKRNFYDLVNFYRVEEAKQLLLDPKNKNYTILSVGFEAGFNSKTTFNTIFKKFTGQTPTAFRDDQLQPSNA